MDVEEDGGKGNVPVDMEVGRSRSSRLLDLLRRFLEIQQRRAGAYAKLQRGFNEYMISGGELAFQQLCRDITIDFNDCSKEVIEMELLLVHPELCRDDLASLLKAVQALEKQKLHLTAQLQVLKKAGRPSERTISQEHCGFIKPTKHEGKVTEATQMEDAEADAEYDSALKEVIKGVQDTVTNINDHLIEVRYEIDALESG